MITVIRLNIKHYFKLCFRAWGSNSVKNAYDKTLIQFPAPKNKNKKYFLIEKF